ncbi:MAG: Aryl-alcohol dehydrogenase [Magnetococcales bacterium]|nr:Aryl-alcohol dehydrogenase [Magnetococcales bacterium]HIJ84142.1 aldo/keto reductase [Magnetococcales bacterium]
MKIQKLGLGTVQFGLDYGISNQRGRVSEGEAWDILSLAANNGVTLLDTATGYGDSELVLGGIMAARPGFFRVVTKLPVAAGPEVSEKDGENVAAALTRSLSRLGLPAVYGLLAHHATDLLKPDGHRLIRAMEACRDAGMTQKIGVSIYTATEIDGILDLFTPDVIQLPINVADQRLIHSGHLEKLKKRGVEIHARSIFLQGLLLMPPEKLPDYFSPVRHHFAAIHSAFDAKGWSPLEGCLRFAMEQPELDFVLTGVTGVDELEEIVAIVQRCDNDYHRQTFPAVPDESAHYLNPACWQVGQ